MLDKANAGLAQPFRGVTGGDGIVAGLFPLARTGISLAAVVEAARSLLATLTAEQRKAVCFAIGDEAWRKWSNIHPWLMRHGVCLADLRHDQREAVLGLMRESMSASGYRSAHDVMKLNEHALEITGKQEEYGEWLYWISIFGTPSPGEPWGWQIDGHHLALCWRPVGDDTHLHGFRAGAGAVRGLRGHASYRRGGQGYAGAHSPLTSGGRRIGGRFPSELLWCVQDNRQIDLLGSV
jgi:hypothetical protein